MFGARVNLFSKRKPPLIAQPSIFVRRTSTYYQAFLLSTLQASRMNRKCHWTGGSWLDLRWTSSFDGSSLFALWQNILQILKDGNYFLVPSKAAAGETMMIDHVVWPIIGGQWRPFVVLISARSLSFLVMQLSPKRSRAPSTFTGSTASTKSFIFSLTYDDARTVCHKAILSPSGFGHGYYLFGKYWHIDILRSHPTPRGTFVERHTTSDAKARLVSPRLLCVNWGREQKATPFARGGWTLKYVTSARMLIFFSSTEFRPSEKVLRMQ